MQKYRLIYTMMIGAFLMSYPLTGALSAEQEKTSSAENARVYFIDLHDGSVVREGALIHFGLSRMGVAPAGIEKSNTGHHHLLIDDAAVNLPPLDEAIPSDETHIHFGGGQTEYILRLPRGKHTLRLLLGDMNHMPHNPPVVSKLVHIKVIAEKTFRHKKNKKS